MKNMILAGVGGSLGKFFLTEYLKQNYNIIGITRKKNKTKLNKQKNFKEYKLNLENPKEVNKFYKNIYKDNKDINCIISSVGKSNLKNKKLDWQRSINDNLISNINLVEEFRKVYKRNKNIKIILISSIAGIKPIDAPESYSVAKNALNFYCKLSASKLSKNNININCISPGNILAPGNVWDKKLKKNKKKTLNYIKKNVPIGKFCKPEHIKFLCDYLIQPSGDLVTGSNFIIDGGQTINV